jgi:hypothetical protein
MNITRASVFSISAITLTILASSAYYVNFTQKRFALALTEEIQKQEADLVAHGNITKRHQTSQSVSEYVSDCSGPLRGAFDNYLDKLATYTGSEIAEKEALFEACAGYFANSKMAMVADLKDKFQTLQTLNKLALGLGLKDLSNKPEDLWQSLVDFEDQLAKLLKRQLAIQIEINALLKSGVTNTDPKVRTLVEEASKLQQSAAVLNNQIDQVWSKLE